jgi:gliding motility-associated-like protein
MSYERVVSSLNGPLMKKFLLSFFSVLFCVLTSTAQNGGVGTNPSQVPTIGNINWSVDPFEHALFVENTGQFDTLIPGEKIYFEAKLGAINAFFTAKGVLYRHIECEKLDFSKGKDPDQNGPPKRTAYYLKASWVGSDANVTVDASIDDKLSYYYTYPKGTNGTYFCKVYKKITYHNLYPGIDVVYSFPEGSTDLEYTVIVHPGANLDQVKLNYKKSKGMHVDGNGNVVINNSIGTVTETAPKGFYLENHQSVQVSSEVNNPDESFVAKDLDATKTLMIDPTIQWTTNPNYTNTSGYDYAFDLDYDNVGNVYAYGGGPTLLQLVKLNPAGAIVWVFNATTMTSSTPYYGDFAVDKHSEECYTVEGWNSTGGARQLKISPAGALMATDPGNIDLSEMWRIQSSQCPDGFVVFGGGTNYAYQAAMLDTNMAGVTPVNIIGASCTTGFHDQALTAVDPLGGFAWTGTTQSLLYTTLFNNDLIKSPLPALAPNTYMVPDNFAFDEINSIHFLPANVMFFNGFNGLVAGRAWLYAYNGDTLKQINKNTGAVNAVLKVSTTPYTWSGLDIDLCENVYLGNNNAIQVYNSSLSLTATLPTLAGTIYDLAVGSYPSQLLYACGRNFVSSISLGPTLPDPLTITKSPTTCALCSGSATVTANFCGAPDTVGPTYLWSDGETTRKATHLCSGVDTIAVTIECGLIYKDTVTINSSSGGYTVTRDSTGASCALPGNASVSITGGNPPYTYNWSNGSTTSSTGPVGAGSYCVGMRDNSGCFDSLCITVTGTTLPTITIAPAPDTICNGGTTDTITASGGVSYVWTPAAGLSCTTCAKITATASSTTTYTVVGTDANGCSNSATVVVDVLPPPAITITAPGDSICNGQSLWLTAHGGMSYVWAPSSGLSCTSCTASQASPLTTTTYTVIGTNANGCTGAGTFTVKLSEQPILVLSPNMHICSGNTVTLMVSSSSSTGLSYQWMPGGSTSQTITVTPSSTQIYTITATDACGVSSSTVTVDVLPGPTPNFNAELLSGCPPACIPFRDLSSISNGKISQWEWNFGNGDTSNMENPVYCYPKTGLYSVTLTATSDSGCSATLSIKQMITVFSNPAAAFTASPQPTDILQPYIQFTDQSTDAYGIVYWYWNFGSTGDSNTSYLENPHYTYSDTGTYCIKMGVMNQHGCVDTVTNCIVIDPIFTLYIPDAFTPNGDGLNDAFMAKGNDVKTFEMYIFDRWGMQLFHSTNINDGWDGTVKGSVAMEDTYVYMITATDNRNNKHSYTGKVTLIR